MKLILSGGGSDTQIVEQYQLYADLIDVEKKVLYMPLAMAVEDYSACYEWIKEELRPYGIHNIFMATSIEEIEQMDLINYNSIFIGGGNTYRLLELMKNSSLFKRIRHYLNNDGVVFGGSAGAIIFGEDIDVCKFEDENKNGITDTEGFGIVQDYSLFCHYDENNDEMRKFVNDYVKNGRKIICIPEESAVFIDEAEFRIIGKSSCKVFSNAQEKSIPVGEKF